MKASNWYMLAAAAGTLAFQSTHAAAAEATTESLLMNAAGSGAQHAVETLLDQGVRVNTTDDRNRTALHYAAAGGHQALSEMLLQKDAAINSIDASGHTPLDLALAAGHSGTAAYLRDKGAIENEEVAMASISPAPAPDPAISAAALKISAEIGKAIPQGWACAFTSEPGKMGHPHGLGEPAFRIDITNPSLSFPAEHGVISKGSLRPELRLHFHPISQRAEIEKVVEAEQIYSWDIPEVFAVTPDYIVIISPEWMNHGYHTEKSKAAIAPLLKSLAAYFGRLDATSAEAAADFDAIKPGMTRREVEATFRLDGGLTGASPVRFLHPKISNLKIDVTFDFKRDPSQQGRAIKSPDDKVTAKSKPYNQPQFFD